GVGRARPRLAGRDGDLGGRLLRRRRDVRRLGGRLPRRRGRETAPALLGARRPSRARAVRVGRGDERRMSRTLALVPARGGSKGLPGKTVRRLAGLPLIVHSLRLAAACPEVDRVVVSTDSPEIAEVARSAGAEVPFLRPAELARDDTPMLPVMVHAL